MTSLEKLDPRLPWQASWIRDLVLRLLNEAVGLQALVDALREQFADQTEEGGAEGDTKLVSSSNEVPDRVLGTGVTVEFAGTEVQFCEPGTGDLPPMLLKKLAGRKVLDIRGLSPLAVTAVDEDRVLVWEI